MLLTFDCYGTLIDWETGILGALRSAYPTSAAIADETLGAEFHAIQNRLKTDEYRSYRSLLTEVAAELATSHGWDPSIDTAATVPASIPAWLPFEDTNRALKRLQDHGIRLGILSNIDDDLLTGTLEQLDVVFDHLGTAQQLKSYKPATPHFELGAEWARAEESADAEDYPWLHVAQSLFHDIVPTTRLGLRSVWLNRRGEARPADAAPVYEAPDLDTATDWILSAG